MGGLVWIVLFIGLYNSVFFWESPDFVLELGFPCQLEGRTLWLQAFWNFVDIELHWLNDVFGPLLLYTIQFCFEHNSVLVDLFIGVREKLLVDFVPALWVLRGVWFGVPVRDVTLDELEP